MLPSPVGVRMTVCHGLLRMSRHVAALTGISRARPSHPGPSMSSCTQPLYRVIGPSHDTDYWDQVSLNRLTWSWNRGLVRTVGGTELAFSQSSPSIPHSPATPRVPAKSAQGGLSSSSDASLELAELLPPGPTQAAQGQRPRELGTKGPSPRQAASSQGSALLADPTPRWAPRVASPPQSRAFLSPHQGLVGP